MKIALLFHLVLDVDAVVSELTMLCTSHTLLLSRPSLSFHIVTEYRYRHHCLHSPSPWHTAAPAPSAFASLFCFPVSSCAVIQRILHPPKPRRLSWTHEWTCVCGDKVQQGGKLDNQNESEFFIVFVIARTHRLCCQVHIQIKQILISGILVGLGLSVKRKMDEIARKSFMKAVVDGKSLRQRELIFEYSSRKQVRKHIKAYSSAGTIV